MRFNLLLTNYIKIFLFFSNNSQLIVIEYIEKPIYDQIILLNHKKMTKNEFQKFHVPLHFSFQEVQIKFQSILQPNAFIAISNTKMVDIYHNEMSCKTIDNNANIKKNDDLFKINKEIFNSLSSIIADKEKHNNNKQPLGSFINVFKTNFLPTVPLVLSNQLQQQKLYSSSFFMSTLSPFTFSTLAPPNLSLIIPYNPFKPMLENGLVPIVPLKDDLQRLTALQKIPDFPEVTNNKVLNFFILDIFYLFFS